MIDNNKFPDLSGKRFKSTINYKDMDFKNNFTKIFGNDVDLEKPIRRVLILTRKIDKDIDFLGPFLIQNNIDYVRINSDEITNVQWKYTTTERKQILQLIVNDTLYDINDFDNIIYRYFSVESIGGSYRREITKQYIQDQWQEFLYSVNSIYTGIWINGIFQTEQSQNRVHQIRLASESGFRVPETIITNQVMRKKINDDSLIVKALHSHFVEVIPEIRNEVYAKSVKNELDILVDEYNNDSYIAPLVIQKNIIHRIEIRVFYIDNFMCAIKYFSGENDEWHRNHMDKIGPSIIEMSIEHKKKISILINKLGLKYAALDFIWETSEDRLIFLEVNPFGDWRWLESRIKEPVFTNAIINYILRGEN